MSTLDAPTLPDDFNVTVFGDWITETSNKRVIHVSRNATYKTVVIGLMIFGEEKTYTLTDDEFMERCNRYSHDGTDCSFSVTNVAIEIRAARALRERMEEEDEERRMAEVQRLLEQQSRPNPYAVDRPRYSTTGQAPQRPAPPPLRPFTANENLFFLDVLKPPSEQLTNVRFVRYTSGRPDMCIVQTDQGYQTVSASMLTRTQPGVAASTASAPTRNARRGVSGLAAVAAHANEAARTAAREYANRNPSEFPVRETLYLGDVVRVSISVSDSGIQMQDTAMGIVTGRGAIPDTFEVMVNGVDVLTFAASDLTKVHVPLQSHGDRIPQPAVGGRIRDSSSIVQSRAADRSAIADYLLRALPTPNGQQQTVVQNFNIGDVVDVIGQSRMGNHRGQIVSRNAATDAWHVRIGDSILTTLTPELVLVQAYRPTSSGFMEEMTQMERDVLAALQIPPGFLPSLPSSDDVGIVTRHTSSTMATTRAEQDTREVEERVMVSVVAEVGRKIDI